MRRHFLLSVWLVLLPAFAYGQSISVVWNANPPEDQVTGYEVCISTTPLSCNVERASVSASETAYAFTPTPGVLYRFAVRAVNDAGPGAYTPEVSASIPALTQPPNQTSTLNNPISPLTLSTSDPDGSALQFSHSGLPFGLSLNANTGAITGTPTSPGAFNVTVFVSDNLETISRTFVWTIQGNGGSDSGAPALAISSHTSGQTVTTSSITLAGTASDGGSGGSGIVSVTVNGATATGGTASGSNTANWSRNVSLSTGANTLTVVATDGAGNVRMSTLIITRTTGTSLPTVTADSSTPDSGSGATQTFALRYSDSAGAADLAMAWVWFSPGVTSPAASSCMAYYDRNGARLYLLNNAGTTWMAGTLGSAGTLQNSQCAVNLASSSVTLSGTTLTLNLATSFRSSFSGTKNIYLYAANGSVSSGWQARGVWTVGGAAVPTVTADSATPDTGLGTTQTFALRYSDSAGAADLAMAWVWFSPGVTSPAASSCMAYYDRNGARLYLLNNAGTTWMAGTLGSAGTLQNSQCAVNLASSSVTLSGNTLTLNLATSFRSSFSGTKYIYLYAANGSVSSGWQARGSWTIP